jgi:hypothetical protein
MLDFNGRQWLLVFDNTSTLSGISYWPALATLIAGFALSGLLFGLMRSMINMRADAARLADKLTEEISGREELLKEALNRLQKIADRVPIKYPDFPGAKNYRRVTFNTTINSSSARMVVFSGRGFQDNQ